MQGYFCFAFFNCGKVIENSFYDLNKGKKPIDLALVHVDTKNIKNPHVLINYSQNLEFNFGGVNPNLTIVYRIIRKANFSGDVKVLETFEYKASEVISTTVEELKTIEPLVLNYCDCLDNRFESSFTYIVQIAEATTENTSFNISNQEISAIVNH